MNKTLKVKLSEDSRLMNTNYRIAKPEIIGVVDCQGIVTQLCNDGLVADAQLALEIISLFNRKAAEMAVSGYIVNTGLVKISAEIKGAVYGRKWNLGVNKVDMSLSYSDDLKEAITDTTVEILCNDGEQNELGELENDATIVSENGNESYYNLSKNEQIPACGIAFRQWLYKS